MDDPFAMLCVLPIALQWQYWPYLKDSKDRMSTDDDQSHELRRERVKSSRNTRHERKSAAKKGEREKKKGDFVVKSS